LTTPLAVVVVSSITSFFFFFLLLTGRLSLGEEEAELGEEEGEEEAADTLKRNVHNSGLLLFFMLML